MQTISLSLYRWARTRDRLWAFLQMQAARAPLARLPGIEFFKLMGTGSREGFHPWPNTSVVAILCAWTSPDAAREGTAGSRVYAAYRQRAAEHLTLYLEPTRVRGNWDRRQPFRVPPAIEPAPDEPIAVLTRATIRRRHLLDFWRTVPGIRATIPADNPLLLRVGMGEVPWLHQVTFTIWRDEASLDAFAHGGSVHHQGARAAIEGGWFSEDLFARFRVSDSDGTWEGHAVC